MIKSANKLWLLGALLWAMSSSMGCEGEQIVRVHQALKPYFVRFEEEAALRGVDIDLEALQVEGLIQDIEQEGVSGQSVRNSQAPDQVIIDAAYWARANAVEREFVVFHELGHCALGRGHLNTQLPDGSCASMMHSGTTACRNAYGPLRRTVYLDELFQGGE